MKTSIIAFVLAASAFAGAAQAAVTSAAAMPDTSVAQQAHRDMGKTRAEVRNELVQAQKSGQIAALSSLYRGS
ncbi:MULTISPECIES: DUF4148 domain-containing protein [unclassified Caballeronia]|uniref:DUF4148 domain-containing protein n=1 Tax=unclassified Caballeronia TaxID=2646786 RepID=UPI0028584D50|nr:MULTISPECIES: DUF4148 domain-containing protein [unclassified Caballeronia]MDR5741269.1 DUF4148 domain-containing protein [Caballeronia sp. LZ016]MDR5807167.1 DUF4148 domain-containing protein [Caballeronia sp. LZ019]